MCDVILLKAYYNIKANKRSEFFRGLSEKPEYERPSPVQPDPAHADFFERLIFPRPWVRFPCGLHGGVGPFKLPRSQSDVAHLGGHPGR